MKILIVQILFLSFTSFVIADDLVKIPAGSYQMGCSQADTHCSEDEGPSGGISVEVPAFSIDRKEVTVADYRECVAAGKCQAPEQKWCNYFIKENAEHPMNCVNWNDADNYCSFKGKRLPTEAEWEKAARAGSITAYPWGNEVSCEQAILNDGKTTGSAKDALDGCGEDNTFPVGTRKPNALGIYDMNGNILEWVQNWYTPNAFSEIYAKGNLQGPVTGEKKVARGGSWDDRALSLRVSNRDARRPEQKGGSLGFRCAK